VGLRFYRRLLQMGISSSELWNNLGLSCFYASQVGVVALLPFLPFMRTFCHLLCSFIGVADLCFLCWSLTVQYDMSLSCFERALAGAADENMADVW